ncbi:MAG: ATP-binding protein [Bacteroidia bacterium]
MIQRTVFDDLLEITSNFPALMLIGPRQIGKTTIAKELAMLSGKAYHYFDLENENDLYVLKNNALEVLNALKNDMVIIDEVQTHPPLLSALRSIIDSHRVAGRFILLGSADPSLVKGISESLAGRVIYQEITQININEAIANSIDINTLWFRGGFPESLLLKTDKLWYLWTDSFINAYVYRDMNKLFDIKLNPQTIIKLWAMLAHLNSEVENLENIGRSLGITGTQVKKYIEFMQGAYLIRKLAPWHVNNGKRLVKSAKIYIRTPAILHHLLQVSRYKNLLTHPALGASWEAFVVEQIYNSLPNSFQMYYYRTQHGAEIDVVIVKGVTPIASIEIKYSDAPTLSKGNHECASDLQTNNNYVITPNSRTVMLASNFKVVSLVNFIQIELIKLCS